MSVSVGILYLRKKQGAPKQGFRVPFVPWIPILAFLSCGYLVLQLPSITWVSFFIWLVIGLVIYFSYGRRHSTLNKGQEKLTKAS
jgi:APA family basic amino acid/polyamine antiporter